MYLNSKKTFGILWLSLVFTLPVLCQNSGFEPWDYRATGLHFYGKMGIGITVGAHQNSVHLITDLHLDYTSKNDENGLSKMDLPIYDAKHAFRGGINFNFIISRNWKLYNKILDDSDHPSWTFQNNLGFKGGMSFRSRDFRDGLVPISDKTFKDTRFEINYTIRSFYNTGYFRKLSNVVGQVGFKYGKMNERWDFSAFWGNDMFLIGEFSSLKRDHGVTNVFNLGISMRLKEDDPFEESKVSFDYENMIITDRRTGLALQTPESRMGRYEVLGTENSFHNYQFFSFGFENDYCLARARVGKDDLKAGRNLQRFAHQGDLHLTLKKRLKFLNWFKGTESPLFPWEEQPEFYQYPELIDQFILIGFLPIQRTFN